MPVVECTDHNEVKAAHDEFVAVVNEWKKTLADPDDAGPRLQQAQDFYQGSEVVFRSKMLKKKHKWYKFVDDAGKTRGLLRLEIETNSVHIANVAGLFGGGKLLVQHAINFAQNEGKDSIDLSTADSDLPAYYEQFGFKKDSL